MCIYIYYRPVNLIHETKDRWVYALAFGALTVNILSLILNGTPLTTEDTIPGNIWRGTRLQRHIDNDVITYLLCRNRDNNYNDDFSIVIFCSFRIDTWTTTNCVTHYWICLCLTSVSHQSSHATKQFNIQVYTSICNWCGVIEEIFTNKQWNLQIASLKD